MKYINKSNKLRNVCYDIRGPIMQAAKRMEEAGETIIKLNIGNTAPFGFSAAPHVEKMVREQLAASSGYSDSLGIQKAREAILKYVQSKGIKNVRMDDIILGNGVSELIHMTLSALLNHGDEVLIPAPDYPLWTASTVLAGGQPVHYLCDEAQDWQPNIEDITQKITDNTKAIVVINPNNPTGALYGDDVLKAIMQLAAQHDLMVFADEIYDKTLYEGTHTSIASLSDDVFCLTFNGLSKNYRACGYRAGWLTISGPKHYALDYLEGLQILSGMRLCANVPAQHAIYAALEGPQDIQELVAPGGRLRVQRDIAYQHLHAIEGVSCVQPKAALYMFPRLDANIYPIDNDQEFIHQFLLQEKVLLVQGTGFHWIKPDHVRIVFLPEAALLEEAIERFARFLGRYADNPNC